MGRGPGTVPRPQLTRVSGPLASSPPATLAEPVVDRRIRLAVISPSEVLRRRILDQADLQYFEVVEHVALEQLPFPSEGDTTPVVVVVADEIEASQARPTPAVAAIGIQDIVPLDSLTSMRLRDVAMASLAKERRLEELKLERNRAIIQGEVTACLADARTGLEALEIVADGIVALGCAGVSCWQASSDRLVLGVARGDHRNASPTLPRSEHPMWSALASNETVIVRGGGLQLHVPLATGLGDRWVVHATVEGSTTEARIVSLEQVIRHAAEALGRTKLRQELDAAHDSVRALAGALREHKDASDLAALLEDAITPVEPLASDLDSLDLSVLLSEAGFTTPEPAPIEVLGDRRVLERALRALHRTLSFHIPDTGVFVARTTADEHAAYVEVHVDDATCLARVPGFDLVRGSCGAHGGQAWIEDGSRICLQLPRTPRPASLPTVSLEEVRTPSSSEDDAQLSGLRRAFLSPKLGRLLDLWLDARRGAPLPHPERLRGAALVTLRPDMAEASVHRDDRAPTFTFTMLGPRLERRLGGTLVGPEANQRSRAFHADLVDRYRECARSGRPTYDYVRQRGDDGWNFERLILPCTRGASEQVSDLLALVLFDGF